MEQAETLNVKQVAEYLQLKPSTVYAWAQGKKIPAIKVGRSWCFNREDVVQWLEEHRVIVENE